MNEAEALPAAQQNGTLPEAGPQLPPGTITLPPALTTLVTRLVQQDQRVQDVLYAYLQGKGETGPLTLVLPVVLLIPPKEG
jgi:hypothetical protein